MTVHASWTAAMPSSPNSFFLAGVMQGARAGRELADQSYRTVLKALIHKLIPQALVHDPAEHMWDGLRTTRERIRQAHAALRQTPTVDRLTLDPALIELTEIFHRQTAKAGTCDVCLVFLPDNEPSMGTAAEMLTAYCAGKFVVTISSMRQNLAVLACSHLIVESIADFESWLSTRNHSIALTKGQIDE